MITGDTIRRRSRVKITHLPTGISVSVSATRSHHKNKNIALKLLQSKIRAMAKYTESENLISCYEIKNDNYYPDELEDCKIPCADIHLK